MTPDLYSEFGKSKFGGAEIRVVDAETKTVLDARDKNACVMLSLAKMPHYARFAARWLPSQGCNFLANYPEIAEFGALFGAF